MGGAPEPSEDGLGCMGGAPEPGVPTRRVGQDGSGYKGRTVEVEKGFFTVFPQLCKGCGLCVERCPVDCMSWSDVLGVYGTPAVEISDRCIACGTCQTVCPDCAIAVAQKTKEETGRGKGHGYPAGPGAIIYDG